MDQKTEIFKKIVLDYQDKIYRLCRSYVRNEDDSKDLYQNILIKIWKSLDTLEDASAINTWIFRISVNTSIDHIRQINREMHYSADIEARELTTSDKTMNIEEEYVVNEEIDLLNRAIGKLTFLEQTLVSLYLEDLKHSEIAAILGISEKNVGVKLFRIKKKLAGILDNNKNEY